VGNLEKIGTITDGKFVITKPGFLENKREQKQKEGREFIDEYVKQYLKDLRDDATHEESIDYFRYRA